MRIDANYKVVDIINDDIDAGIRFGTGDYPDIDSDFLFPQEIILVCSPALLEQEEKLEKPEDLKNYPLLHCDFSLKISSQAEPDWDMWFRMNGVDNADTSRGIHFSQHDLLVQAAIEGQGVALVASVSANKALKEGLLVQPFKSPILLDHSFYFICSRAKSKLPRIQAFRKWLLSEADKVTKA